MAMLLNDMIERNAQTNGRDIATRFRDRSHTWSEFSARCARLAEGLRQLGVQPGARVAILAQNSDRYTEFFFAVARAGAVFVPINTRLAVPEIAYWLEDSGSQILFVDDEFLPLLADLGRRVRCVKQFGYLGEASAPPPGLLSYEGLVTTYAGGIAADRKPEDLVGLFYTGGTTGKSKGVMLSHRNLIANAFNITAAVRFDSSTRYLHAAPMFHLADGAGTFAIALTAGCNFYVPKFDPRGVMEVIAKEQITDALLVPSMINMLLSHPEFRRFDVSSLRQLIYGGSPMPEAVVRKAMEMLPAVRLTQAYGQSEASPCLTLNMHEHHALSGPHAGKLRSAGRALYGIQLRILDEDGNEADRGQVGEICARGDIVMTGYWNKPEQTAEALRGGWLHTGDMGTMDEEGFVFVVDRLKDMIVSGGENVFSVEVEQAIYQHPAVAECAAIGIPHETWGEAVHAVVRIREGERLDERTLIEHCHALIAGYKCPRSVEFRSEPLPLSGAGKILKSELRKGFWTGRSRQVN
jgi:long-chain acyl-CoA synthetase